MKTVHKFDLIPALQGKGISMPADAYPMYVAVQRGHPYVWAVVDTDKPMEDVHLIIHGTGHELDPNILGYYIGSFMMMDRDALVFHVWRRMHG